MPDFVSGSLSKSIADVGRVLVKQRTTAGMSWSLYDVRGRRKYLVPKERWAFLDAALDVGGAVATFCATLVFTGARISEILALTPERLDEANGAINIETLKRRQRGIIRAIPVPLKLFDLLDAVHNFRTAQLEPISACERLWPWSRTTAWRRVKDVMHRAGEPEHVSQPKALRHAFGAEATLKMISPLLVQKWMGHARRETTQTYTTLVGAEERSLARITWQGAAKEYRH
jgi:integrase/recombinase XerD